MPWDNNSNGGGRGGGPWGQSPEGGGGSPRRPGGGGTPNLEELFNRGRDQFGGGMLGGRWIVVILIALLALYWLSNSIYQIQPQQVGVVTFLGKPQEQLSEQGLHFMLWPLAQVQRVNMTQNQIDIGSTGDRRQGDSGLMLSGDQNIVDVTYSVFWQVADPRAFLFNVKNPQDMVRRVAESAMREVVGRSPAQDVFRGKRDAIQLDAASISQEILNGYGAGVTVKDVKLVNVAPPAEVSDAFDEVQRAEQDQTRFQEEARQYSNTKLGDARGQAAQIREGAAAYKDRAVKDAQGEAARFNSLYNEYVKAPDVTRRRLYLETMEQVLGNSDKVIMEKGASGSGVIPYLPLPAVTSKSGTSNAGSTQGSGQ